MKWLYSGLEDKNGGHGKRAYPETSSCIQGEGQKSPKSESWLIKEIASLSSGTGDGVGIGVGVVAVVGDVDGLNKALVIPLLKPDKPTEEAASHRQVSVLPSSYKWYELVLFRPWMNFVYEKKLMPKQQHGASKAKSTMNNVLQLLAFATPLYEKSTVTFLCSLDQKSAFTRFPIRLVKAP